MIKTPKELSKFYSNIVVASSPRWYRRDNIFSVTKTSVTIPAGLQVNINDSGYILRESVTLNLASSSDTIVNNASNRAGKDLYIYACVPSSGNEPNFVISSSSTIPTGYNADNSRKIGGFHCLCAAVGNITSLMPKGGAAGSYTITHPFSNYAAGDIIPNSVWDLLHRASSENEGMVFVDSLNLWVDIYLPSWSGSKIQSVYGGTILDGSSAMPMHGERFAEFAGLVNKRLCWRDEFVVFAKGSNECTNIKNNSDPGTTGGHVDSANRRMISNYGIEDCCGVLWQWTANTWGAFSAAAPTTYSQGAGQNGGLNQTAQTATANGNHYLVGYGWVADGRGVYSQSIDGSTANLTKWGRAYGAFVRCRVGAAWGHGWSCGSRSVDLSGLSSHLATDDSARLVSEPRIVNL